ncbi:MAG: hypothetical protein Q9224_003800 [Gallowayella concinna]
MAASSPPAPFQPQGLQPSLPHESSKPSQAGDDYKMMVLRFSHETTEDEVDRQFLRTALDLGINVPRPGHPTTTLGLVTKNVSAQDLTSTTASEFCPPPSRTSDSTHPTSCSSSEQRSHTKTSSLTSSSMTSAPSSIDPSLSHKSSYTKIRSGIRRISTLKRRKTIDTPEQPPIPLPIAAIKTLRPLAQHRPATLDHVPFPSITRNPTISSAPGTYPDERPHEPSPSPTHQQDDNAARHRSLNHPQLKQLRWSQVDEQRRFICFETDQHRLMRSWQEHTRRRLLDEHPQKVKAVQHRHLDALSSLEHRHLSAEIDLEQTLEVERQACATRLKHMQAYCNPRSIVQGMPSRIITQQHHWQLDQQYHVRNGMANLHASRINVLREKQAKQLERIMTKQELEVEQMDKKLATTMQDLETTCESETQILMQEFVERRERLVSRWSLAEAILRKRLENETGETYGLLPPIPWNDRLRGDDEIEDLVDDDLARDARMAYDASTLNMI